MENKVTKVLAVLTVLGFMTAGSLVYAESPGNDPGGKKGWKRGGGQEFFKELNLTPEQKEKMKAQREAHQALKSPEREQLKAKMEALYAEIAKPGTTRADVNGLVDEVNVLKGQMFSQRIDGVFAMKEVLTPEQFAKMQEHHKNKMKGMRGGWGKSRSSETGPEQD